MTKTLLLPGTNDVPNNTSKMKNNFIISCNSVDKQPKNEINCKKDKKFKRTYKPNVPASKSILLPIRNRF